MKNKSAFIKATLFTVLSSLVVVVYSLAYINELKVLESVSCLLIPLGIERALRMWQDVSDTSSWKSSLRAYLRGGFIKRDDYIRISFAYLFRIFVEGKYFLVQNSRGIQRYQPVGGAYKCLDSEKLYLVKELNVITDDKIPIDETSKNDYRMRVQLKNIKKFFRRFDKTKNRETIADLTREFNEEVNKVLGFGFEEIKYTYIGRDITEVQFSKYFQCYEVILADIVILNLDAHQYEKFKQLINQQSEYYMFATANDIEHCGVTPSSSDLRSTISEHSIKILESYSDKLIIKKNQKKEYAVPITVDTEKV